MADFVDKKRAEMEKRLKELKPYVEEHDRLEAAIEALGGVARSASRSVSGATRRATRRPASRKRGAGTGKRGRPKGSGKRGKQCADLVKKNPGITIRPSRRRAWSPRRARAGTPPPRPDPPRQAPG